MLLAAACGSCGTANAADSRFCKGCGAPLGAGAASEPRVRDAAPRTYTPQHLAQKILTSRSALEGERKVVTVLFVDVSGFTALAERLDPEDVHQLMDQAFEVMLTEIHRYEGTVNQFLGDGLMALFGAPIAHEDHPVRALHAALGIQKALATYRDRLRRDRSIDFRVRQGLNTGGVVVGRIGDNLRMDYTAIGDTTNLAARLLALAPPGQILVGEDTARAGGPYFVLSPLGEVAVKGKALPVRAYQVEGARAVRGRLEAESERGLTPLVGRERELAIVEERLAEVREGHGQVVLVSGEAGIGKSRLLLECRHRVERAGVRWVLGRCVSFGRSISYLPVLDLVRDFLGIKEGDGAESMGEAIERGIREAGAEVAWTIPFVRALLSLDAGDPEVSGMIAGLRRGRTAEAIAALLVQASRKSPVAVVVEDLHWIDPHSEEVLRVLLEGMAAAPLAVLLTYRPGYSPPFTDQTYHTRIALRPLAKSQTTDIVGGVLQASDVPAEVHRLIAQKAEGNPLFIEELAKALVEDGTLKRENGGYRLARPLHELAIPDTIQGVITARIDRLPEPSKNALQVASVIGREFTARLVERVSAMERDAAGALGELRAVELIYAKATYPELAYMFKHALTHEVAYESLLKQRRRALHHRAGEVIEELYQDHLPEFYETLAWHFGHGEAWPKAVEYCLAAASKNRERFAYAEGARFCRDAIEIMERHGGAPRDLARAFETLGDLESLLGNAEAANQAFDRAIQALDDPAAVPRVVNKRHRAGIVLRDGARIAYFEHGTGEPTLLFLHPVTYGLATFQPTVEVLCQEYRAVTVDPRGVGRSDPLPERPYLLADRVEDAVAVIEAVGGRPVVVVGLSAGGSLAVNLAAKHPDLVEKLVLVGTSPCRVLAPDYPVAVTNQEWRLEMADRAKAGDYDRVIEIFLPKGISEPGARPLMEESARKWRELSRRTLDNFFTSVDPDSDIRSRLPTLRVPTLVLQGAEDRLVPPAAARWVAAQIPGAQFYLFLGKGHFPQFRAPAEFADVLRSFLATGHVPESPAG
jgi:class 3 adenylate cyclase/pimeloyl-ACP methyl ester carboxylesterase